MSDDIQFDTAKVIADLRDHLARHDKPIAFLFGAGTSCAVSKVVAAGDATSPLIPAVAGLTEICKTAVQALGEGFTNAWSGVEKQCKEVSQQPHIENILSRVRLIVSAIGSTDKLLGLDKQSFIKIEKTIRATIARTVNPSLDLIPKDTPHRNFAKWLARATRENPVEIFTVNYDILIENALEAERIPIFDGFVGSFHPFFYPETLRRSEYAPGSNWVRLWKLHGSVTWRRDSYEGESRIIRGAPDNSGEMILPSFEKYDESRQQPYSAYLERLGRFVDLDDSLLVTAGFSFGDDPVVSQRYSNRISCLSEMCSMSLITACASN